MSVLWSRIAVLTLLFSINTSLCVICVFFVSKLFDSLKRYKTQMGFFLKACFYCRWGLMVFLYKNTSFFPTLFKSHRDWTLCYAVALFWTFIFELDADEISSMNAQMYLWVFLWDFLRGSVAICWVSFKRLKWELNHGSGSFISRPQLQVASIYEVVFIALGGFI